MIPVQQHRICFVIGLFVCTSTLRRSLPRICGTAEQVSSLVVSFGIEQGGYCA